MNPNLIEYIRRYISISETEINAFQSYLIPKKIKKKEFLLKQGEFCKSRYFITKGCIRLFYIDNKGNEQIVHFGIDNWWITDYESFINRTPSKLYIQAIENTELLELPQETFEELCKEIPQTEKLFRIIMEKTYIAIQKRIEFMYSLKGDELFKIFVSKNPEFTQRVPQYMIASYLGMSPEFVSKIKNNILS
ncbi:CRP-like cAMP-binding protein [Wenyingzhuangia heitensis]|uniref:CRP-like cAMP-binding protein n=1 Tax=Wenyingzhuangia heitensis TaxID=1487859 RepID=A0ABX0UCM3_9FLAO|nr:Crp/Fnr family transcriptional regulator [Wenyingzhuangia heitensis]NIJ46589.1 CRP-like cAMP-binding protein [Wenyingzhuangia heitensis]